MKCLVDYTFVRTCEGLPKK